MGEKGLLYKLGLIVELDPVPGLMVSHCMLQDHELKHLLCFRLGELGLGDKGGNVGGQGMVTLNEGLESLSVFTLKHYFQLLPAYFVVISFFGINVKGFQVIYGSGIEDSPVLKLPG